MYSAYLTKYNQIINNDSPAEIALSLNMGANSSLLLTADVTLTGDVSTVNNKIVFLLTRYISDSYCASVVGYEQQTFELTTTGETGTYSQEISFDSEWNLADIKAVAIIQTYADDKEILQAAQSGFSGTVPLFSSNIQSGPANLNVNFTDSSLPQGGIESWEWDFDGDGTFDSTEQNPTFTYTTAGSYDVTLKIYDGEEYTETVFEDYITVVEPGTAFSGTICGEWTAANNPYVINGDVIIEADAELIINPGTQIVLEDAAFMVYGSFIANATADNRISFTSETEWDGVRIIGESVSAEFSNCLFSNATQAAISIENGPAVTIEGCQFVNNHSIAKAAAIDITNTDDVIITRNLINFNTSENGPAAIGCTGADALISNNIIVNNSASYSAFSFKNDSTPIVKNNTIANNTASTALMMFFNSNPLIMNNIIRDDLGTIISIASLPNFSYNNISGGADGEGNIDADPMFVDSAANDFMLAAGSPCIDAGNPLAEYNDLDGTINDMGAWGGQNAFTSQPVSAEEENVEGEIPAHISFYPNPFNLNSSSRGVATIAFDRSMVDENSALEIYNIRGQKVRAFAIQQSTQIIWDGRNEQKQLVPSGVYLIKLSSDKGTFTQKAMLLK